MHKAMGSVSKSMNSGVEAYPAFRRWRQAGKKFISVLATYLAGDLVS